MGEPKMKTDFNFRIDFDCELRQVKRGKRFVVVGFLASESVGVLASHPTRCRAVVLTSSHCVRGECR